LHTCPVIFLGYELRSGRVYPPEEALLKFGEQLKFRGREEREQLIRSFVRRFRFANVPKTFRRLDRRLSPFYPYGLSLVGFLDRERE
jgi:hypothetical protein